MRFVFLVGLAAGLVACNGSGSVQTELDSTVNKVKNSETLDSIEAKGERILDSVKNKGGELWDSTKAKGGKLIDAAEEKIDRVKRKDSTR